MATTRKRSSGFAPQEQETIENAPEEQTMEVTISDIPEPEPYVELSIQPTPDRETPAVIEAKPLEVAEYAEKLQAIPPKRHPRNIPKFSRNK